MIVSKKRTPRVKNSTDYTNRPVDDRMECSMMGIYKKKDKAKRASQQFIRVFVWLNQKERPAETIRRRTYV